jgi:hypothetical protein
MASRPTLWLEIDASDLPLDEKGRIAASRPLELAHQILLTMNKTSFWQCGRIRALLESRERLIEVSPLLKIPESVEDFRLLLGDAFAGIDVRSAMSTFSGQEGAGAGSGREIHRRPLLRKDGRPVLNRRRFARAVPLAGRAARAVSRGLLLEVSAAAAESVPQCRCRVRAVPSHSVKCCFSGQSAAVGAPT